MAGFIGAAIFYILLAFFIIVIFQDILNGTTAKYLRKEKKLKEEREKEQKKEQKLINEAQEKKDNFYRKFQFDYKKWESMTDSKEKEKLWGQLAIQEELWDKIRHTKKHHPDFVKTINLHLKKQI